MKRIAIALALFGFCLVGQVPDPLVIGVTTREEAVQLFGPPTSTMDYGKINVASWSVFDGGAFNITTLTFNKDGVLQAKNLVGALPKIVGELKAKPAEVPEEPKPELDYSESYFTKVSPAFMPDAKVMCKKMKTIRGPVFLDETNFKGEAVKGFVSELLIGVRTKKAPVRIYIFTPKLAFVDSMFEKVSSYEDFDETAALDRLGKKAEFFLSPDATGGNERYFSNLVGARTSLTPTTIKQIVIKMGEKIVKPRKERGAFWFPLNAIPKAGSFEVIAVDVEGHQAILELSVEDLVSKGVV